VIDTGRSKAANEALPLKTTCRRLWGLVEDGSVKRSIDHRPRAFEELLLVQFLEALQLVRGVEAQGSMRSGGNGT
jgi:hypothetical protein